MIKLTRYYNAEDFKILDNESKERFASSGYSDLSCVTNEIELNPKYILYMVPQKIVYHDYLSGKPVRKYNCVSVTMVNGDKFDIKVNSLEELHLKCCINNGKDVDEE